MKKLIVLALLVAGQVAAWGQTVNVHMKDGSVIKYDASGVDYVNFSAASNTEVKHEAVDLGLPSGLKWATCNVGATKPEETGYYICWGELEVKEECGGNNYKWRNSIWGEVENKEEFTWCNYKWTNECQVNPTKYVGDPAQTLEPEDDAAHVLWGGSWRMPTENDIKELFTKCSNKFVIQNGVQGLLVTGNNGNTIFLPFVGYKQGTELKKANEQAYWWTSTKTRGYDQQAIYFGSQHDQGRTYVSGRSNRFFGFNIRAVTTE